MGPKTQAECAGSFLLLRPETYVCIWTANSIPFPHPISALIGPREVKPLSNNHTAVEASFEPDPGMESIDWWVEEGRTGEETQLRVETVAGRGWFREGPVGAGK